MSRVIVTGAPGPGLWAAAAALISQGWEPLEPPEGELDPLEAHALEVLGDRDPGSVAASPVLATLCERALALARGTWLVPPPLAEGWEAEPALAPIANSFRSIVGVGDRWVWADPRALLLLPWLRVLLAPGSVVVVVTGSAASVEGEVAPLGVLPAHAWALWSRYRSAAVVDGGPFLIVDQEALSGDATTVAERLAALVGAPMSEPVAWLDESPPDELADEILDRERELHLAAIRATAFVPTDGPPTAGFSITAALQALLTERQALSAEVGRLQERAESRAAAGTQRDGYREQLEDAVGQVEAAQVRIEGLLAEVGVVAGERDGYREQLEDAVGQVEAAQVRIDALVAEIDWFEAGVWRGERQP